MFNFTEKTQKALQEYLFRSHPEELLREFVTDAKYGEMDEKQPVI